METPRFLGDGINPSELCLATTSTALLENHVMMAAFEEPFSEKLQSTPCHCNHCELGKYSDLSLFQEFQEGTGAPYGSAFYGLHGASHDDFSEGKNVNVEHYKASQCYWDMILANLDLRVKHVVVSLPWANTIQRSNHQEKERILEESLSVVVWTIIHQNQLEEPPTITICAMTDLEERLLVKIFEETKEKLDWEEFPDTAILNDVYDLIIHPGNSTTYLVDSDFLMRTTDSFMELADGCEFNDERPKDEWTYHLKRVVQRDRDLSTVLHFYLHPRKIALKGYWPDVDEDLANAEVEEIKPILKVVMEHALGLEDNLNILLFYYERFMDSHFVSSVMTREDNIGAEWVHLIKTLQARIKPLAFERLREYDWAASQEA